MPPEKRHLHSTTSGMTWNSSRASDGDHQQQFSSNLNDLNEISSGSSRNLLVEPPSESAEDVLEASLTFHSSPDVPRRLSSETIAYPNRELINQAANHLTAPLLASASSFTQDGNNNNLPEPETTTEAANASFCAVASVGGEATVLETEQEENPWEAPMNSVDEEHARLVELKRAAYYGGGDGGFAESAGLVTGRSSEPEATVVSIAEEDVHPSDISYSAVQAELIGQDFSSAAMARSRAVPSDGELAASIYDRNEESAVASNVESVSNIESNVVETEEATILENETKSSSMMGTYTEEATVLEENNTCSSFLDSKPPAVETSRAYREDEAEGVAVVEEEAEVVSITEEVHPAELFGNETRAELIGHEAVAIASPEAINATSLTSSVEATSIAYGSTSVNALSSPDQVAQASVAYGTARAIDPTGEAATRIDCEGVVGELTSPPNVYEASANVSTSPSGQVARYEGSTTDVTAAAFTEALNVFGDDTAHSLLDSKPPAVDGLASVPPTVGASEVVATQGEAATVGNDSQAAATIVEITEQVHPSVFNPLEQNTSMEQGEVVAISEEVHPVEITGHEAQAELVGSVAAPSNDHVESTAVQTNGEQIEEAAVMTGSAQPDSGHFAYDTPSIEKRLSPPEDPPCTSTLASPDATVDDWLRSPIIGGDLPEAMPPPADRDGISTNELPEEAPCNPPTATTPRTEMSSTVTRETSATSAATRASASSRDDSQVSGFQSISNNIARGTNSVLERLFGESVLPPRRSKNSAFTMDAAAGSILPRTTLPWSVLYSDSTKMWIATINTNQKALDSNNAEEASKAVRAFSVSTEKQALTLARSWSPPRMHPFSENSNCFVCETKFAVFRRACHCRNCGVCVCSSCCVQWPAKMLPDTYNIKNATSCNVCKACDWLCSAFRLALLQGSHDEAVALHATGNVNLYTPFANVKGELFYPVHCAVLGRSLRSLKWLVDDHCCPVKSVRISGRARDTSGSYTPILTSKGRSLLGMALENKDVGIIRYLVVEKGMLLANEKSTSLDTVIGTLDIILRLVPSELLPSDTHDNSSAWSLGSPPPAANPAALSNDSLPPAIAVSVESERTPSDLFPDFDAIVDQPPGEAAEAVADECIICFSKRINCVATPCGHQICCLDCGNHLSRCPVCSSECSFLRVFRA